MSLFATRMKHRYPHHWRHLYLVVDSLTSIRRLSDFEREGFCRRYIEENHIIAGIKILGSSRRSDFDDFIVMLVETMFPPASPFPTRSVPAEKGKVQWYLHLFRIFRRMFNF